MFKRVIKTLLFSICAIAAGVAAQFAGLAAGSLITELGLSEVLGTLASAVIYPLLTFLGIKLIAGKGFKYDISDFRINKPGLKLYWLGAAVILPLTVTAAFQFANGHWIMCDSSQIAPLTANGILFTGLAAGISEEVVFRGAVMGAIEKEFNSVSAVLIPSVAFAAVHIAGRSLNSLSTILLLAAGTLVGIMFSLIEIQSRSFWNNALVHAAWNTIILGILHTDAAPSEGSVFTYVLDSGSVLLTGGDFGIESSLVAVIAYSVVIIMAIALMSKRKIPSRLAHSTY